MSTYALPVIKEDFIILYMEDKKEKRPNEPLFL
jgi:hypothetical protein